MAVSKTVDVGAIPARCADMAVRVSVPPFLLPIGVSFLDRCIVRVVNKETT